MDCTKEYGNGLELNVSFPVALLHAAGLCVFSPSSQATATRHLKFNEWVICGEGGGVMLNSYRS